VRGGVVDRGLLSQRVVGNAIAMKRLEQLVHPLVREEEIAFRAATAQSRVPVAVLDIPLLFETGGDRRVDAVVVTARPETQRARVLARAGMTPDRFEQILARQTPDAEKRRRAHFIVDTEGGLASAKRQVADILRALAGAQGRHA
jgi:dephospho-CoA kinase